MKSGYINCPFCDNEIKEGALKCQYCHEFIGKKDEKTSTKNSNSLLYVVIGLLAFMVLIMAVAFFTKDNNNSLDTSKNSKILENDVLQFDLDKKCKDEYLKEYIYENMDSSGRIWYSYFADKGMGDHNHSADSYYADVFYSPVEKQCIFAFKREYIACDPIFSLCESDEDLETDDFSELEYHIEEATMMGNENKSYMREHFYYTKGRGTIDDMLGGEKTTRVSNVNGGFYGFMDEQRNIFDKELNRLKGK